MKIDCSHYHEYYRLYHNSHWRRNSLSGVIFASFNLAALLCDVVFTVGGVPHGSQQGWWRWSAVFQEGRRIDKMTARSKRRVWGVGGMIERPQRTDHHVYTVEQLSPLLGKRIFPTFFLYGMDADAGELTFIWVIHGRWARFVRCC